MASSRKVPEDSASHTFPFVDLEFVPARPHLSTFQLPYYEVSQSWIAVHQHCSLVGKKKKRKQLQTAQQSRENETDS